jgi:hypothetical protein
MDVGFSLVFIIVAPTFTYSKLCITYVDPIDLPPKAYYNSNYKVAQVCILNIRERGLSYEIGKISNGKSTL